MHTYIHARTHTHAHARTRTLYILQATISINGVKLGVVTDQFVRTNYSITKHLAITSAAGAGAGTTAATGAGANTVSIRFDTAANGRWMACSGGWDWGSVN